MSDTWLIILIIGLAVFVLTLPMILKFLSGVHERSMAPLTGEQGSKNLTTAASFFI